MEGFLYHKEEQHAWKEGLETGHAEEFIELPFVSGSEKLYILKGGP